MIKLEQRARLECDEPGCEESIRVSLVLLPAGTLAPQLPKEAYGKWQLLADTRNPMQPFHGRCQFHSQGRVHLASASDLPRA